MIYIDKQPNPSGAYPNPKNQPFPGCIALNDEQAAVFFAHNGFVTVEDGVVTPNTTAWEVWEAWKAAQTTVEPTPAERREQAYNTEKVIEWDGSMLTVTEAAKLWQYYAAEGSDKATQLQALIAAAKAEIRTEYPDSEAE